MNTLRLRLRRLLDRGERRKQRRRKRSGRAYHLDIIQGPLSVFRIASSNYWRYPELTYRSANLFPSQLCELLSRLGLLGTNAVIDMATFVADVGGDTDASQLGKLFSAYGSDKERHGYHIAYAAILSLLRRNEPLTILEIGLGTNNSKLVSSMGSGGTPGASLRAFRDFLPTSTICGADVDRSILFHEENQDCPRRSNAPADVRRFGRSARHRCIRPDHRRRPAFRRSKSQHPHICSQQAEVRWMDRYRGHFGRSCRRLEVVGRAPEQIEFQSLADQGTRTQHGRGDAFPVTLFRPLAPSSSRLSDPR